MEQYDDDTLTALADDLLGEGTEPSPSGVEWALDKLEGADRLAEFVRSQREARDYKFIAPMSEAAEGYIEYVQNPEGRFMFGMPSIDAMIRGFGRGELAYVTGRAHSGKTQVVLNAIANNPGCRALIFTPDEVAELILVKLISITQGINSEDIEAKVKQGDKETIELVRRVAAEDLSNLLVIDKPLSFDQMLAALREAEDFWQSEADVVVIDFLELLPGSEDGAEGVTAKSQHLKRWSKEANVPVICLHQASRSSGGRGQASGMDAMRYGGETEAIFVLEVFRKRDDKTLDEFQREQHKDSVTVNVAKNKRPPCKTGTVDLTIEAATGRIKDNWRPLPEPEAKSPQDVWLQNRQRREAQMRANPINFDEKF